MSSPFASNLSPAPHSGCPIHSAFFAEWVGCSVSIAFFVCSPSLCRARRPKESIPTPEALAQLQQRAAQANPSEQCFLYTELVHGLTQQAAAQIAADDPVMATATLRQIDKVTPLIQHNLTHDSNRLKDAELLLQDTTYRLSQMLHLLNGDDHASVQDTLRQLNHLNDELLTQVFTHYSHLRTEFWLGYRGHSPQREKGL